jgi:peptidoglycan/LPS O-acetylase OafA/YrhL
LRGIAALCVVFDHMSTLLLQSVRDFLYQWLDLGQYGVFVFFLVSGYIIPASLERKGSVRSFWVSRAFRLYPLYALAVVAAVVAWRLGYGSIRGAAHDPAAAAYSQLLMLSNLLSGPNVPNVVWSLSYEMVFYLLLTALFAYGVHRHSAAYALSCAVAALALGGILPMAALLHVGLGARSVDVIADTLIIAGLALAVSGWRLPRAAGAAIAAITGLTLLAVNQDGYPYPWSGFTILALMFTGTMLYRAEHRQTRWATAIAVAVAVFVLTIAAGVWHSLAWHMGAAAELQWQTQWTTSLAGAGATFAAGLALRHRKVPAVLAWLGLISYSVYLLHPLILNAYREIPPLHHHHPLAIQLLLATGVLAVVLACSAMTYRLVEAPMQQLGRRVARALQTRLGPG